MDQHHPKISCICITHNRVDMLRRAVACFMNQDYPNKELVISYPESDFNTAAYIRELLNTTELNLSPFIRGDLETLGSARNHAIAKCTGDYICIWDDDDWYHPWRLTFQFDCLNRTEPKYQASILMRIILFNTETQDSYISFPYTWDGSILCRKEIILQNPYSYTNKGEDTHVVKFLDGRNLLYHIHDAPFLYIYTYHGTNTWEYEHFKYFVDHSELLTGDAAQAIQKALQ